MIADADLASVGAAIGAVLCLGGLVGAAVSVLRGLS